MTFEKNITIPKADKDLIEVLLREPQNEAEWVGDGVLYVRTFTFENGLFMDVMICGVSYFEYGGCNTAWTQAVLFDKTGHEIACTEVEEDFFGRWEIEYNGETYVGIIEEEAN